MLTLADHLLSYELVDWSDPINRSHPLNRGLAAWFLAVPGRYRFGSLTWQDLTRWNVGTLTNSPVWGTGGREGGGGYMRFGVAGSTTVVSVPHHTRLNLSESASSVAFWLYAPHAQATNNTGFLDKGGGGLASSHAWAIRPSLSADSGQIVVVLEDGSVTFAAGSYLNNQWCHIVVTWDGTNVRLYRNGLLLETIAQPVGTYRTTNAMALNIGALNGNTPYLAAQCRLDDIRLYDSRVLSASMILDLYKRSCQCNTGLLNRIPLPFAMLEQPAATGSPWYYYAQQQLACSRHEVAT